VTTQPWLTRPRKRFHGLELKSPVERPGFL
jgi:hypothetical protein